MRVRGVGLAHLGQTRESNQDCWLADDQLGLYVVADGMGGHRGGELAAATAIDAVAQTVRAKREELAGVRAGTVDPRQLGFLVEAACQNASLAVFEKAAEDTQRSRMGCTLTVLLVSGGWGVMGHVGDSRLYACRRGVVHQLSDDHTIAAELARQGAIKVGAVRTHQYAHVLTRSIGARPAVSVDVLRLQLLPEDRFLLCSDGLTNYVSDPKWLAKELCEEDLDGVPTELVKFANDSGGGDNITALVVAVEAEPDDEADDTSLVLAKDGALESCFLFSGLSLARKAKVINHCELVDCPPGPITLEGEPLPGLVLVVRGEVLVERCGERLGVLAPGQHWGASSLLASRPARATVLAERGIWVLTLAPEGLRSLTRSRPRLGALLLRRLAAHLGRALDERTASEPRPDPALAP